MEPDIDCTLICEDIGRNIWGSVVIYTVLRFISGGGCLGYICRWLWIPLEQYSYEALSVAAHSHLMNLSSEFYDSKSNSDLMQAIHGGRSVSDLTEVICFEIFPMLIDLLIAFSFLWSLFGPYMSLILVTTVITYIYTTMKLLTTKADNRRDYITFFRKKWAIGQQSPNGWVAASVSLSIIGAASELNGRSCLIEFPTNGRDIPAVCFHLTFLFI